MQGTRDGITERWNDGVIFVGATQRVSPTLGNGECENPVSPARRVFLFIVSEVPLLTTYCLLLTTYY